MTRPDTSGKEANHTDGKFSHRKPNGRSTANFFYFQQRPRNLRAIFISKVTETNLNSLPSLFNYYNRNVLSFS